MPTSPKNSLVGGMLLCAFPAVVLLVLYIEQASLPMPWPVLFAIFFVHGIRAVVWSLFKLDVDNAASWVVDAVGAAGLAVIVFWVAWYMKEDSSDNPPFPNNWIQNFGRILFAGGGLLAALVAARTLKKALNQYRQKPDDGIRHI